MTVKEFISQLNRIRKVHAEVTDANVFIADESQGEVLVADIRLDLKKKRIILE